MFDQKYDVVKVPVDGGELTVGRWGSGPRTVVAAHGVTANHACFHPLADALGNDFTVLAPDLRGRAGSRDVGPQFGMVAHAEDLATVVRELAGSQVLLLGHSMGGFVAAVTAARHPDLVREVVLVDGGLPLDLGALAAMPIEDLLKAVLGPAIDRLGMTFESVEAYLDHWRPHPALAGDWSPYVERYLEVDLVDVDGALRPSTRKEAVIGDTESDLREGVVEAALRALRQPVVHLRAPRGLLNQEPPLYPEASLEPWRALVPQLRTELVDDCNHYTILLSESGAQQVAGTVHRCETAS